MTGVTSPLIPLRPWSLQLEQFFLRAFLIFWRVSIDALPPGLIVNYRLVRQASPASNSVSQYRHTTTRRLYLVIFRLGLSASRAFVMG